jgi:hypothetical protein
MAVTPASLAPPVLLSTESLAARYGWTTQYARLMRVTGAGPRFLKPTGRKTSRCFYRYEDVLAWESNYFNSTAAFDAAQADQAGSAKKSEMQARRKAVRSSATAPAAP